MRSSGRSPDVSVTNGKDKTMQLGWWEDGKVEGCKIFELDDLAQEVLAPDRSTRVGVFTLPTISCVPLRVWSWSRPRCRTERHSWRLPPATARLPTHMAGPVACLGLLRSLNSRTPLLSGSRECV